MKILEPHDTMQNRLPNFQVPLNNKRKVKGSGGVVFESQFESEYCSTLANPQKTNFNHVRSRSTLPGREEKGKKEIKKQKNKKDDGAPQPTRGTFFTNPPPQLLLLLYFKGQLEVRSLPHSLR